MTDIDRDNEQFNNGVTHTVELLAKTIGATGWVAGDGSEDYDEDLAQTLLNILAAKGLYDSDECRYAALSPPEPTEGQIEAAASVADQYKAMRLALATELDRTQNPNSALLERIRASAAESIAEGIRTLSLQDHAPQYTVSIARDYKVTRVIVIGVSAERQNNVFVQEKVGDLWVNRGSYNSLSDDYAYSNAGDAAERLAKKINRSMVAEQETK